NGPSIHAAGGSYKICNELTHAPVRKQRSQLRHGFNQFFGCGDTHGIKSPMDGNCPTRIGRSSITSTRTVVPGASLAIRVARVTPLLITNSPSLPRLTSSGGMPWAELPNFAICR